MPDSHPSGADRRARVVSDWRTIVLIGGLLLLGVLSAGNLLGPEMRMIFQRVAANELNPFDRERLQRGYYEALTGANRLNGQLWEVYGGADSKDARIQLHETSIVVETDDFLQYALRPSLDTVFRGAPFQTNSHGLRDREYVRERAGPARRIAMLGQSYTLGVGVANEEVFESVLERMIAEDPGAAPVEILNFGMSNSQPVRQLYQLREIVLAFQPDVVVSVAHPDDIARLPINVADALIRGHAMPFSFLQDVVDELGMDSSSTRAEVLRKLAPLSEQLYRSILEWFVRECESRGVLPVWVMIPTPDREAGARTDPRLESIARAAGFVTFDLSDVYGRSGRQYRVAEWDRHPNAEGHVRIARRLHSAFLADGRILAARPTTDEGLR